MSKLLMVSADGHAGAPGIDFLEFFEESAREAAYGPLIEDERRFQACMPAFTMIRPDRLDPIDHAGAIRAGRSKGDWNIKCRLEEMDREGIAAEIIFPGSSSGPTPFLDIASGPQPPELRSAGTYAYHRWLVDHIGDMGKGRVFAIAYTGSAYDLEAVNKELRWASDQGCFVGVNCPGHVYDPDLPPLYDRRWDPFWATCVELNFPVTIHAGFRGKPGEFMELSENILKFIQSGREIPKTRAELAATVVAETGVGDVFSTLLPGPRHAIWEMMLGGVFDRFPSLKFVPTEVAVDWLPAYFDFLDERFEAGNLPVKLRPSEYWQRNGYAGATNIAPVEAALRHEIGVDKMMFGRDYPHPEGMWPNTLDWLRAALSGYTEQEARGLLGENAVECYGLDRASLLPIAERIGPNVEEILGDVTVDPRYIDAFNDRSGFLRPAEVLDLQQLGRELNDAIDDFRKPLVLA